MPRKSKSLSLGARIPLRGFTQLLKNLSGAERDRLASAFADAENMLDFHNRTVPQIQNRRRISGLIDAPVLTATGSILGASVRWDRLDDTRISFYEIQIDNTNTFPNPQVFEALDTFFTLENVNTVKFIRIRGVRGDGEAGNWSEAVRVQPTITAPQASSHEFYQGYSGSEPDIIRHKRYGGPGFYNLFEKRFYIDREVGSISAWGYISNRLTEHKASNIRPWDRVRFKVNGIARMDQYFPLWTDTFNDLTNYPQVVGGVPMSFYMKGGYTAAFGPYDTDIPSTLAGEGPNDPHLFRDDEADTPSDSFYWSFPRRAHNQMKWEQGQQAAVTDLKNDQETFFTGLPASRRTGYLTCQDFRFNFDPTDRISGVEVYAKRRQILPPQNLLEGDDGPALPNLPLDTITEITNDNITDDAAFGRHVSGFSTNTDFGISSTNTVGEGDPSIGLDDPDRISVSLWVLYDGSLDPLSGTRRLFSLENTDSGTVRNLFELILVDIGNQKRIQVVVEDQDSNLTRYQSASGAASAIVDEPNVWHHVIATWDGTGGTNAVVIIDGQVVDPFTLNSGGTWNGYDDTADRYIDIIGGRQFANTNLPGSRGQVGLWNRVLSLAEAQSINDAIGTADLRSSFGNYSSDDLLHYWLRLPGESDIRDFEVFLIDENGDILTETVNQAVTTESWPLLDTYSTLDQADPLDGTALPSASGIPHDNITGIGYQLYGSPIDTWGFYNPGKLTAAVVNSPNFGVAFRARNEPDSFAGTGLVDHIKMTVYRLRAGKTRNDVILTVEAGAHNNFYVEREVLSGLFNTLEVGPRFAPDLSDC
jgi:hypothetical protein